MTNYKQLLSLIALGLFMSEDTYPTAVKDNGKSIADFNEADKRALMERIAEERKRQLLKKGIKEFMFDGVTILALNEKNAKRKYNRYLKFL